MKPENHFQELFERAASAMGNTSISDDDLKLIIKTLRAMEAFFSIRGRFYGLIKSRISEELDMHIGFLRSRKLREE